MGCDADAGSTTAWEPSEEGLVVRQDAAAGTLVFLDFLIWCRMTQIEIT